MSDRIYEYLSIVHDQLRVIEEKEKDNIVKASKILAKTLENDGIIYAFGTGHSQMFAIEMFYRAGGLVPVNPMLEPSVAMYSGMKSSEFERLPGIGKVIFEKSRMTSNDCLLIVSHSGRNSMPVDLAIAAKEAGVKVITIASSNFMNGVQSRHKSGNFVKDYADVFIDNRCAYGDAVLDIEGMDSKVVGTSSILSITIVECIVATTIDLCLEAGFKPPVWISGNVEGGDAKNMINYMKYRNRIPYL